MASNFGENIKNIIVNTGNILSLNDITNKPGQNHTEELVEALNITLKDFQNGSENNMQHPLIITRKQDDSSSKMAEYDAGELKFALKLFLESDSEQFLTEALDRAFSVLNVTSVHNVIISYHSKQSENENDVIEKIKNIWKILEKFYFEQKILQIGLSDIEEAAFRAIYEWASVKPNIIQINLTTCCVVPQTLREFCKDNDVQLLTHSDPHGILPDNSIKGVFGNALQLNWVLRFLVHIKCRGVLTTKGYLVSLSNL